MNEMTTPVLKKSRGTVKNTDNKNYNFKLELKHQSEQSEMYEMIGTPFHIAKETNQNWVVLMGTTIMDEAENNETKEELAERWATPKWMQILAVAMKVVNYELDQREKKLIKEVAQ